MIHIVLDANVALDWFMPTEVGERYSASLMTAALQGLVQLHVPVHFDVEVLGQLVKNHRRNPHAFPRAWLTNCLDVLETLPLDTHVTGTTFKVLGDLCIAYNLTAYDVPYLHLARMLDYPIASRDRGVLSACKAWHVGVWAPE